MSSIQRYATIYLSGVLLMGGFNNWIARRQIQEDIQLFIDDPSQDLVIQKYKKYNIHSLRQLQATPSAQRRYINDCTITSAGKCVMWPFLHGK